jgi:5S rRNA maturation endonuclease (ribonuclease M5)
LRSGRRRKDALLRLEKLFSELPELVDVVVVEGSRDIDSIRSLGYEGPVETLGRPGVNDYDLSDELASKYDTILLLLDFDEEGLNLNNHFTQLLERKAVKVGISLRKYVGRLMAAIGVYAIESLDNIRDELDQ